MTKQGNPRAEQGHERGHVAPGVLHDEASWPIVIAVFRSTFSAQDLTMHLAVIERLLGRSERFGMLYALEHARLITAAERRSFADFIATHSTSIRHRVAGCAIASSNSVHQGALTALGWLVTLPFPTHVCSSIQEGKVWLAAELAKPSRFSG